MPAFKTALLTSAGEKYEKTTPSPEAVPPCKDLTSHRTYIGKYSCSDPRVACVLRTWCSDTFAARVYEHGATLATFLQETHRVPCVVLL